MIPGWCLAQRFVTSWDMARAGESFTAVEAPCTVAQVLRGRGVWSLGERADFDHQTWIFRTSVEALEDDALVFEGLTPNTEIRVDGVVVATADNMFVPMSVPLTAGRHTVELHCLPLDLSRKKPRARWRSKIFDDPQRRWIRATAVGHTPTFGPSFATVGPWRPVHLSRRLLTSLDVRVRVAGRRGVVQVRGALSSAFEVTATLSGPGAQTSSETISGATFDLTVAVDDVALWWPHTHGTQPLYTLTLDIDGERFATQVAFRHVELDEDMLLRINGQRVFCRGACWTPVDAVAMAGDVESEVRRVRDAGFNMLRVPANTSYESDAFYRACTAAGILVWQDFMFASLDFPFADDAFADSARREAVAFLTRVQSEACIAVLCANSEVRMQAHMMGVTPPDEPFYDTTLPKLCAGLRPDVPFVNGTPSGGTLGFEARVGCAHYYGVGAYRRPLSDARLSGVRFASEALGFAQRPGAESHALWHDVPWEHRILRFDAGASDFADQNEHYVRDIFGVDPLTLRTTNRPLYDALLDIVPGVVMEETYATWRSSEQCHGALVWLLRDMWRSTGLGLIDADGRAKPAFHYLRRAFAPCAVFLRDEGVNGLDVHMVNERPDAMTAPLKLELYRDDHLLEAFSRDVSVTANSRVSVPAAELIGRFADTNFAFRFGPKPYDLIVARWGDTFPAYFFPGGIPAPRPRDIGMTATRDGDDIVVSTKGQAHTVIIENAETDDNYFHLAPGETRRVHIHSTVTSSTSGPIRVRALSSLDAVRLAKADE